MELNDNQISALNDLLKRNYDAARGYSEAANAMDDKPLRSWLFKLAKMHRGFIDDLEATLLAKGAAPRPGGTFLGKLHRVWLNFVSSISARNRQSILEECKRGARLAVEDYDHILDKALLPEDIQQEIRHQRDNIEDEVHTINNLLPSTPLEK